MGLSCFVNALLVNALTTPSQLRTLNFRQATPLTMYTQIRLFLKEQSTMIYYGSTLFVQSNNAKIYSRRLKEVILRRDACAH